MSHHDDLMRGINRRVFSADTGATELLHIILSGPIPSTSQEYHLLGNAIQAQQPETANTSADLIDYQGIKIKDWIIGSNKSHITPVDLLEKIAEEANLTPPEMVFGGNQLMFFHVPTGVCYNFLAVEALKCVHFAAQNSKNETQKQLKVAIAKKRSSNELVKELDISYDWTYTSEYRGSLSKLAPKDEKDGTLVQSNATVLVEATDERIDMEKLKEREPILWFDDVSLYEDELHDHGISIMNVKARVMPSGFYILARYWLRLDQVVLRVYETRVHHLFGSKYLLREYSRKESTVEELAAKGYSRNMADYRNVDQFHHLLTLQEAVYEKILLE